MATSTRKIRSQIAATGSMKVQQAQLVAESTEVAPEGAFVEVPQTENAKVAMIVVGSPEWAAARAMELKAKGRVFGQVKRYTIEEGVSEGKLPYYDLFLGELGITYRPNRAAWGDDVSWQVFLLMNREGAYFSWVSSHDRYGNRIASDVRIEFALPGLYLVWAESPNARVGNVALPAVYIADEYGVPTTDEGQLVTSIDQLAEDVPPFVRVGVEMRLTEFQSAEAALRQKGEYIRILLEQENAKFSEVFRPEFGRLYFTVTHLTVDGIVTEVKGIAPGGYMHFGTKVAELGDMISAKISQHEKDIRRARRELAEQEAASARNERQQKFENRDVIGHSIHGRKHRRVS